MPSSDPNMPEYGTRAFYSYIGRKGGLATAAKRRAQSAAYVAEVRYDVASVISSIVARMAQLARENVWADPSIPDDVASAISVNPIQEAGGGFYIDLVVDVGDPNDINDRRGRRAAAAYEYGSGERGPGGADYPITAKQAPYLGFLWEYPSPLGRKYIIEEDEGMRIRTVMHPGVESRPYLRPAIGLYRDELVEAAGKAFKYAIVEGNFMQTVKW